MTINIIRQTTELAMHIISAYIEKGSIIVDATCGNGNDTLSLAQSLPSKLYCFDIQKDAIDKTRSLLLDRGYAKSLNDGTIKLICDTHSNMSDYVKEAPNVIVFNLGYLPGGDKEKSTTKTTTLEATSQALELLAKNGVLSIVMYSGHPEGYEEKQSLVSWSKTLDSKIYHSAYISFTNQYNSPPEILMITRKK